VGQFGVKEGEFGEKEGESGVKEGEFGVSSPMKKRANYPSYPSYTRVGGVGARLTPALAPDGRQTTQTTPLQRV
jgi:hypothetical protein